MPTIGRQVNEGIVIVDTLTGERITIHVTHIGYMPSPGDRLGFVRMAFDAPERYRIDRLEVFQEETKESRA